MINVVIAHDQALLQAGLCTVLGDQLNIRVVGTCRRSDVIETVERHRPRVVVLGDDASRARTLSPIDTLHSVRTPPKVILLAGQLGDSLTADALMKGASGVLRQDSAPELLASAVLVVAAGGQVLANPASPTVVSLLNRGRIAPAVRQRAKTLTPRESEVCALLAEGLSNTEIAQRLHLSAATVKDHTRAIYLKLGTTNRVRAAILTYQLGMLAPADTTVAS